MKNKSKFFTVILSFCPGVGHMYLGLMKKGVQLMAAFFLCLYLTNLLGLFFIVAPIIWFYSLFDALHKASSEEPLRDENWSLVDSLKEKLIDKNGPKFVGFSMLGIGFILIFNKIILSLIDQYFNVIYMRYLQTGIVALILIVGGIFLILVKKEKK